MTIAKEILKYHKIFWIIIFTFGLTRAKYQSQHGQDKYFNEVIFKNAKGGTFLEIGAHDGLKYSNTWFFEKECEWKGMCIEPRPEAYKELEKNRECVCINGAITKKEDIVTFRQCGGPILLELYSGIESKYDARQLQKIEKRLETVGGSCKFIEVKGYMLNTLLEKHNYYTIDYLSLDTEGGELEILKSIDFNKFYVYIIDVENHYDPIEMRTFLESKGFSYVKRHGYDDIYVNTRPYQGNLNPSPTIPASEFTA